MFFVMCEVRFLCVLLLFLLLLSSTINSYGPWVPFLLVSERVSRSGHILSLLLSLIQEGQLSVTGEICARSTG